MKSSKITCEMQVYACGPSIDWHGLYSRVGEAAQALGSNVIALYTLIEKGRPETVRIGRRALVKTESLLKLVGGAQ